MASEPYKPKDIEKNAQKYWEEQLSFQASEDLSKEKFYCLGMFPYPSGYIHVGHARIYTITDVIARYNRMLDKNVLHPVGWDAFGLPAENAAIQNKISPATWTEKNIDHMRFQLKQLGISYDWKRELSTHNPKYYKWEQWFFLKLFEKGLAYKKNAKVNWDPVDNTVLANEQVIDGKGWRSGAQIEQREIPLWFLKITAYADELINDLAFLKQWPEKVVTMQKNWIGRSEGIELSFSIDSEHPPLKIFTSRPDTIFGVTFLALSPFHPLSQKLAKTEPKIAEFITSCSHTKIAEAELETQEKKGIDTKLFAIHPISKNKIPIWIANYVLIDYGTGAIMAVPAHDQRDWEFADHYKLPIIQVINNTDINLDINSHAYIGKGYLINSGQFNGITSEKGIAAITHFLESQNLGKQKIHYRLRDWSISRQRYWGTPIPIIVCPQCGHVPVPIKDLPVLLPTNINFVGPTSPLNNIPEFYNVACPKCGGEAHRETETFDTFINSSWYYARFACINQNNTMLDDRAKYWTPVDFYVGGIEHAVLHLLYARFFHKLMRDEGLLNSDEPFQKLLTIGMVLNKGIKMSKSKGNTISPEEIVNKYGADTLRLFIIFAAPPEQSIEWSDGGIEGANRFLKKIWHFAQDNNILKLTEEIEKLNVSCPICPVEWDQATSKQKQTRREVYLLLQQINYDYQRSQFNTVISGAMKLFNVINKLYSEKYHDEIDKYILCDGYNILLKVLSPICPHITHTLWLQLGHEEPINKSAWPKVARDAIKHDVVNFTIQINGKVRAHLSINIENEIKELEQKALDLHIIAKQTKNKKFVKSIILPERKLVNLVFEDK